MSPAPVPDPGAPVPFAPCLNPATLSGVSLPRFLSLASAGGFGAVEVSIQQAQALGIPQVRGLLAAGGLTVAAASGILPAGPVLPAPLLVDPDTYRACLEGLDERLGAMAALGCTVATTVLNPRSALPQGEALRVAGQRIGELADAAADHGVVLAVEAVGPLEGLPPELDGPNPVAGTLPELAELLEQTGRGNARALVDSVHWAAAGGDPGHIHALGVGAVAHVQIADLPSVPPQLGWSDAVRLFPGEGGLSWTVLAQALTDVGYAGTASVELFNPDLRALPEDEIVRRSQQGAAGCWTSAQVRA